MTEHAGFRVDMHVKVLNERVVTRAKARGMDALVYAPHFTQLSDIEERAAAFSDDDLLVVPAREVFTGPWHNRRHILAVGLSERIPDFITFDGALDALDRQNAAVLVPHPEFLSVGLSAADVRAYRDRIHAVETYNSKNLRMHNRGARELVEEVGCPAFASSYAHLERTVGEAWTTFNREMESTDDLVAALRDGEPRRTGRRQGLAHEFVRKAEFAHLAWENTWKKVDRIVLSGTEPTHPDHIAYDGEFDSVRAY